MPKIPTFPTILDEVKKVTITKLKEWQYLKPNCIKSGTIQWSQNGRKTGSIGIYSDMTAEQPFIKLSYNSNDEPIDYKVRLVSVPSNLGSGKLMYFKCPHTGKRCRKLYGAGTYFLHREAYPDAMYEKQTYSKLGRQLDRAFSRYYQLDDLYEELYSKGFTTHYNGKLTKRYKQIMSKMEKIRNMESPVMKYLFQ